MIFVNNKYIRISGWETWSSLWDGEGMEEFTIIQIAFDRYESLKSFNIDLGFMGIMLNIDIATGTIT